MNLELSVPEGGLSHQAVNPFTRGPFDINTGANFQLIGRGYPFTSEVSTYRLDRQRGQQLHPKHFHRLDPTGRDIFQAPAMLDVPSRESFYTAKSSTILDNESKARSAVGAAWGQSDFRRRSIDCL